MTQSTRFKLTVFSTLILAVVGVLAYAFDPSHIDKFAFYIINTVMPIAGYIVGRSIRSGTHTGGLMNKGTRYKTAIYSFLGSLLIGIVCYILSPEHIDKLGMYMIGVVLPSVGYILGRSLKPSKPHPNDEVSDEANMMEP